MLLEDRKNVFVENRLSQRRQNHRRKASEPAKQRTYRGIPGAEMEGLPSTFSLMEVAAAI